MIGCSREEFIEMFVSCWSWLKQCFHGDRRGEPCLSLTHGLEGGGGAGSLHADGGLGRGSKGGGGDLSSAVST